MGLPEWKNTPLMSLPRELRLEIWEWTLTDPSVPNLTVNISRAQNPPYKPISAGGTLAPRVVTSLQPGRNHPIGLNLLRTNHLIYNEALPMLYRSVLFAPEDHQGIFPLWLDSLSTFARSLIRSIKLHIPQQIYDTDVFGDPAVPLFHWAVTCAQVAKLSGGLRKVEVEGVRIESAGLSQKVRRSVLFPLCKIKTRKVFGTNNDPSVFMWWTSAEKELELETTMRKKQAEMRAAAEAEAEKAPREDCSSPSPSPRKISRENTPRARTQSREQGERRWICEGLKINQLHRKTDEHVINQDLSRMTGIEIFERELAQHTLPMVHRSPERPTESAETDTLLEDWDIILPPRGRPPSYASRQSSDSWSDAASTIAEAQSYFKDDEEEEEGEEADSKSFLLIH